MRTMAGTNPGGMVSDSVGNHAEPDALISIRVVGSYATKDAPDCGSGAVPHPMALNGYGRSDVMRSEIDGRVGGRPHDPTNGIDGFKYSSALLVDPQKTAPGRDPGDDPDPTALSG